METRPDGHLVYTIDELRSIARNCHRLLMSTRNALPDDIDSEVAHDLGWAAGILSQVLDRLQ